MSLSHSHNDYLNGSTYLWKWILNLFNKPNINNRQINLALMADCGIIKIDVIYKKGKVLLSHSPWKPKFLCYGKLGDYLIILAGKNLNKELFLYIEIKTSNQYIVDKIKEIISDKYKNKNLKYIIGAKNTLFSRKRESIAKSIYNFLENQVEIYKINDYKNKVDVKLLKLYKDKYWIFRLNHF